MAWTPDGLSVHSFASILISEGESLAYVQRILGHASIKPTDLYGPWLPTTGRGGSAGRGGKW